tara:strand:- start:347 stop:634 length:288 start_codon:yes stop_codon:yes gene_type:complete
MKVKELIKKLQQLQGTESGEVSFKICTRGGKEISDWDGDVLTEINLISCENAGNSFTEIIFGSEKEGYDNNPNNGLGVWNGYEYVQTPEQLERKR